ncbi:unnamed protein product [Mytilus coruscus]|uniref:Novel STAND NTPase 3 domain-containing protein n=1 Tax=Mytilus coruscus TaxID=42192 RepID=A0A6J8E3U6_MYTCO|nr:unnamed protein product [Mytilus coruscus]
MNNHDTSNLLMFCEGAKYDVITHSGKERTDYPLTMIVDLRLIKLFLVTGWICIATAVVCPDSSQWTLRTRARCNSSLPSYNCLYDESTATFVDFCTRTPDFQRPGYKFIIRGNIDGIECEKNRFQPIKFWTNGSNDCILEKTHCNEPGQVIHDEGSSTSDRTCRCDYTRGFAFVTSPKQNCFCNPSLDDCSCFMKPCSKFQVMTPGLNKFSIMKMVVKRQPAITVTVLTGISIIFVIVLLKWGKEMMNCWRNIHMTETDIEKKVDERLNDQTIFKTKLKVNFNAIITTINSKEIEDKLTLTDLERKTIRSFLGRIKGNKALLEIVWNRGPVTYKEFINVLRTTYWELAANIEKTKDSDYQEELEEELEKIYNDKIPQDVREFHDNLIQEWNVNDNMITETKASKGIYKRLEESNCVFLVGHPGSGKSSILRHIALRLVKENEDEDFDIIPVVVEPINVLRYYNEKRNQIFLLDDFCGKDKVNNQIIDVWKLDIEKFLKIINKKKDCFEHGVKKVKKTKIMISCNTSVYESHIFEPLKRHLDTFVCKISDFPLDKEEREKMIRKYVPTAHVEAFMLKEKQIDFPLLCKLSKGKPINEIRQLFSDPLKTIKEDLTNVQTKDSFQFCAIALCTLFNNEFKTQWLNQNSETEDIRITDAVTEICLEFNLDITNDSDRKLIQEQFDKENMDWLSKSSDTYHHIHDEIFNIALVICGESYQRCFISHAPSSFIAKRYSFYNHIDGLINLKLKYLNPYFNRLFRDLEQGSSYSTFQNIQLRDINYRKSFIEYCNKRELKFKELLGNIKNDETSKKLRRQNTIDFDIKVPLIDCASQGYKYMVELLLKMSCNVNSIDNYGRSALYVASEQGHFEIVQILIANKPVEADIALCDNNKTTPLHMACEEGHKNIAEYLIENGADISACDMDGCSSLHMACASGKKEIVELLLKKKKDEMFKSDNLGQSPIIIASLQGETEVVESLLLFDNKQYLQKQVHETDKKGFTPFLAACVNAHVETARFLIANGSYILHSDNDGRTALFIACEKGHTKIVEILMIKGNKNIIDKSDWHKKTPLYIACAEKRTKIVETLIKYGAEINNRDEDKKTPLYVACERGNYDIVKLLLDNKADINTCDRHKKLPLHVACKGGDTNLVELLYGHHKASSPNCNQWNETALSIARKQGHDDIVKILVGHDMNGSAETIE